MNSLISILNSDDWEKKLEVYFAMNFKPILKDVLKTRLKEDSRYLVNLVLYSFTKNDLFPTFVIHDAIDTCIFNDRYEQLKKFSFSEKMVTHGVGEPISFNENRKNDSDSWIKYFEATEIKKDNNYSEMPSTHKIWIEEIIGQYGIAQISFLPILTGSTQMKVSGVFALNSTCETNDDDLKKLQKIISGIVSPISIQELEHIALQANRKAAISQVLARNMSHNHGSHVLSRMIHENQIDDMMNRHEGIRYILARKSIEL